MRVSASDIANAIRMTRSVHKYKAAVVVEGLKDVRFYRSLIDPQQAFIMPADGKAIAIESLKLLRKTGHRGILAVVDADLTIAKRTEIRDRDVVVTDDHDLEALLLQDYALEKVLSESDLDHDVFGPDLRNRLAAAAIALGYLRWVNEDRNYGLRFKELDYPAFVNADLSVNEPKMLASVLWNTGHSRVTIVDLERQISALRAPSHDVWAICCGHDITGIFAAALSKLTGRIVTGAAVERSLRLAYNPVSFCGTRMCVRIKDWEDRNPPFRILRSICS